MKLHLGCGKRYLKGYVHVDIADYSHIDFKTSVDKLFFVSDGTVDEIYSSHTLEYFDRIETHSVLEEWYRVLKPYSKLFITVPNFESLIRIYSDTKELKNILGPLFGRWQVSGFKHAIFHKTAWDENDLTETLTKAKFASVKKFDPVKYLRDIDPDYDDHSLAFFPAYDQTGIQVSLALCAFKTV